MKKHYFHHRPKSEMAYASDINTLHIRLKVLKEKSSKVEIIYGDPFAWKRSDNEKTFSWDSEIRKMDIETHSSEHDHLIVKLNRPTRRTKYAFLVDGRYVYGSQYLADTHEAPLEKENLDNFFNFPYILEEDCYTAPSWVKDTVWYSIFPDRFHNYENPLKATYEWEDVDAYDNRMFFGGNIKGMTEKLDYLKSMGFSGIYLTPIFKAPSAHKYDTVDYFEIDPQFGTKEEFKTFVNTAHEKGIKVVLDAVFNHVSHQHPFFLDVVKNGKESPYYDYFYIRSLPCDEASFKLAIKNGELPPYATFAFTPRMPKLNTAHPELRQYLLDVARYWVETFDIDGWRLDVSNEISHDFWRDFRKTVKAVKPDCFILGENWDHSGPWLEGDQHDSVMNYEFTFPLWKFYSKTAHPDFDATTLKDALVETYVSYAEVVVKNLFNLLDSHDTKRIASHLEGDPLLLRQIYLFMFLLPGSPSVFYGGEVGMQGEEDPDNRRCMIWDEARQDITLKTYLTRLIALYAEEPAFKATRFTVSHASEDVIILEKGDLQAVFNRGKAITLDCKSVLDGHILLGDLDHDPATGNPRIGEKGYALIKKT